MIYKNENEVSTMWYNENKFERTKGVHKTNFNVKKGIDLQLGDLVFFKKDKTDNFFYWKVEEILNTRQSSLKDYNYIETMCSYTSNNIL